MQILLASATELEIAPFLKLHPSADVLITGVGVPVAMYHLVKRLHQVDYDLVIQAGIAGCFSHSRNLGDVVLVKQDRFADVGVMEKGIFSSIFDKGLADANAFPFSLGWLDNKDNLLDEFSLEKVKAITVNTITDDQRQIEQFTEQLSPEIETMEGAALHYVSLIENTRFLQLRSISNYVGERDKAKWKMNEAINNLNNELANIFKKLIQ